MRKLLAVALVCLSGLATSAFAQGQRKEVTVKIDQAFTVGGKSYAAGSYVISTRGTDQSVLMIKGAQGGETVEVPVITRLARREAPGQSGSSNVVFDKAGGDYALSEVWIPGEDGYLVGERKGEHQHAIVPVQGAKK